MFPLLVVLSMVLFFYMRILPGDPIAGMLGPEATPELVSQLRVKFGLDQSILLQYVHWIGNVFTGNLGISFTSRQEITPILINSYFTTYFCSFFLLNSDWCSGWFFGWTT
jgi:peptide/nickel transport system permease protein